jgi:hypothetical protein
LRKIGIPVAMVVASLGVAGIAQAVDVNQGLAVKTTGSAKGTKSKPVGLKLSVTTTTTGKDPAIDGTYATKSAVIHFDKNLKFNPKSFPVCSADVATPATSSQCPAKSLMGTGSAIATVGAQHIMAHPTIKAYNAKGGKLILVLQKSPNEVDSSGVLTGTLKSDSGKYGSKLSVPIPPKLQNQLGLFITLNKFATVIKNQKGKDGKYYVSSTGCKSKYNFGGDFVFSDGTSAKVTTTSKC